MSFDILTNSIFGSIPNSGALIHEEIQQTEIMKHAERPNNDTRDQLIEWVLNITESGFDEVALDIFRYQFAHNQVYQQYCLLLHKDPRNVLDAADIPFLPIGLFRTHDIHTNAWHPQVVFESSTTTGQIPAKHAIRDLSFYHRIAGAGFRKVTGYDVSEFQWLALLPSYEERPHSSLIHMVREFIKEGKPGSRFISAEEAATALTEADSSGHSVALIGVSFALLDLIESQNFHLRNTIVIETGGMKGRKEEITRTDLHAKLKSGFHVDKVYSEYGMTELLSQAWSSGEGIFRSAPTLRIDIRDIYDPLQLVSAEVRGGINCIDLANVDTCSFIATDDLGLRYADGSFEVLGRFDASELRGCNLMID